LRRAFAVFAFSLFSIVLPAMSSAQNADSTAAKLPSAALSQEKQAAYSDLAVKLATEYFQIDTTNPPGNEARAAAFFKKIFDAEGIENQVLTVKPGRDNIIARLHGSGAQRPIILLSHEDVVTSTPELWKHPPFSAAIDNGLMYARGSEDMKNEAIAHLITMIMLKRENVPLDRDVIFLATADEEVNDTGSEWMIANKKDLFANAEFLVTEGGRDRVDEKGEVQYVGINTAGKIPFWLVLTAHGNAGHGSRPQPDSAPNRLVRALDRVVNYKTEMVVLPVVDRFFKAMARYETGTRKQQFMNVAQSLKDPKFRQSIEDDQNLNYMFRNTITLTQMEGSHQTNVVPAIATAHLDVRLMPGQDPQKFLAEITKVVSDSKIEIKPESAQTKQGKASPVDTALMTAIRNTAAHYFPGTPVTPWMDSGYTENEMYRQLGIVCYGFNPYATTDDESHSEHNNNERIPVEELRRGPLVMFDVVAQVAGK
jgi:acetylornithine deacetylase/succinyl-diaminopimelate desuccinylase-like protein